MRLYDRLFTVARPDGISDDQGNTRDFQEFLNPESLSSLTGCRVEPGLVDVKPGASVQFERLGYFIADIVDSVPGSPVFNRIVTLRDSWAKIEKAEMAGEK